MERSNQGKAHRANPYIVGTGIGVLSWLTFKLMDEALGVSTTFVRIVGAFEKLIAPEHVATNSYLAKHVISAPIIDWQFSLVMFLGVGALIASRLYKVPPEEEVPPTWRARFGANPWLRRAAAVLGGVLLMFGARLAGGCTSGHAISGGLQLAVSSWVFMMVVFGVGIPFAFALYGRQRR